MFTKCNKMSYIMWIEKNFELNKNSTSEFWLDTWMQKIRVYIHITFYLSYKNKLKYVVIFYIHEIDDMLHYLIKK